MKTKKEVTDTVKKILKQLAGEATAEDGELIAPHFIIGSGDIWCYQPTNRNFIKLCRGIPVYILCESYDLKGRHLVYTTDGNMVLIDPEEIIELGFD
jgi:hypothetical protein